MIRQFPFYEQMEEMDCGATCLRMVARYHGVHYSLEDLRELTFMGKQGVSLLEISDAAENIGMETLAVEVSYKQLSEDVPLPCIIHWGDFEHFVVVYKISRDHVWIADPARERFKLSRQEFLSRWIPPEGFEQDPPVSLALVLQPTPDFYEEGRKPDKSRWSYLWAYFARYRQLVYQLFIGLFLGSLLQFAFPFLMKSIVDVGIVNYDLGFIWLVILAQFVLFATQIGIEYVRSWMLLYIGERVNISLISDFLSKLTRLPLRFFENRLTSDLIQRVQDNSRIQQFLSSTSLMAFFSLVNFIVFGLVLLWWNLGVFVVFLGGTLLYLAWLFFAGRRRRELDYRRYDESAENQGNLLEIINGIVDIKLYSAGRQKRWAWERAQARSFRTSLRTLRVEQIQRSGALFINEFKNLVIIFLVARAVMNQQMSLGMLVAIQYVIGQLNIQVNQLIYFMRALQDTKISLERLNEIHLKPEEDLSRQQVQILPDIRDIYLENIHFQYNGPNSPMVLKGINLKIPKEKITAIVGRNGSGKTTLLKLLMGFYPPVEGAVRLGKTNLDHLNQDVWRSHCAGVLQDGYLFADTIARNIALGEEVIRPDRLLQAVRAANIKNFIESLPLGYDTRIGENGYGLSLGQRQSILIARAVYKNPDYLFLDEATTGLDSYNEMVVMENLLDAFKGKTIVVVAQRLSTIKSADNIVVLEDGEVAEQGQHNELTFVGGAYYQLVRNQIELGA